MVKATPHMQGHVKLKCTERRLTKPTNKEVWHVFIKHALCELEFYKIKIMLCHRDEGTGM